MTEKKKTFFKGNIKAGLVTLAAAAVLMGTPRTASAQDAKKAKVENFNPAKANVAEKRLYDTMVLLLETKYQDKADDLAVKIMTNAQQLDGEKSGKYIQKAVEVAMGPEHAAEMAAARRQRGIADVVMVDAREVKVAPAAQVAPTNTPAPQAINPPVENTPVENKGKTTVTIKETPTVTEIRTVTVNDDDTDITTARSLDFSFAKLTPQEKKEFNLIKEKLRAANAIKGTSNSLLMFNTKAVWMCQDKADRAYALSQQTQKTLFRNVDDESFVAYNTENGKSIIYAPGPRKSEVEKLVKKAGGAINFVNEGQQKDVKKTKAKTINDDTYMDFGR